MVRRRTVILVLLWIVSLLSYGATQDVQSSQAPAGQRELIAPALAILHGPYLQMPTGSSMTVVWHTNKKCVSRVEYGATDQLGMTAVSSRNGLIDNDRTSHIISLTGLKPGTNYKYRVVSREFVGYQKQHIVTWGETVASPVFEFTTLDPAKDSFAFSVVSDIHERAQDLESMLKHEFFAGVDFAVYNGDMLNDFMQEDQVFNGFLDVSVRLFAREKPFVHVRGNHEDRGRFARSLPDIFPTVNGRTYFSMDHGGVHFIILDSGEDKEDGHQYYNGLVDFDHYRKEQAEWLKHDLESEACREARFRIVISHIPPRGAKGYAVEQVMENFEPLINAAGVDLWLSGHTHRYQRVDPVDGRNAYPLIIGDTDTITRVDVSKDALQVTVVRANGEVLLPQMRLERR